MPSYRKRIELPGRTAQALYDRLAADLGELARQLDSAKVTPFEGKREIRIEHSMLTAIIRCEEGCVNLEGELSWLASPFRSKIDQMVDNWGKKAFKSA